MFLEGEVDWMLVLGALAGVSTLVAILSLWFAITHRGQLSDYVGATPDCHYSKDSLQVIQIGKLNGDL